MRPKQPFTVANNATDRMIPRISKSLWLRGDVQATRAHFDGAFKALNKPEFNLHDVHPAAFMLEPTLKYGTTHHDPQPTPIKELFGPKTGGGVNPFGWPPYIKHATLMGE
jgi:hypothetical protein